MQKETAHLNRWNLSLFALLLPTFGVTNANANTRQATKTPILNKLTFIVALLH